METKIPLKQITPTPPSATEVNTALESKYNKTGGVLDGSIIFEAPEGVLKGVAPSSNYTKFITHRDANGNYLGSLEWWYRLDLVSSIGMYVYDTTKTIENSNNTAIGELKIGCNSNGIVYTSAPTPATNDNSTQIATTAFVNSRLPYITGTFTPTLEGSTTNGTFTYSNTSGNYVKLGNLVYIRLRIGAKCTSAPSGTVIIRGLPFISTNTYQMLNALDDGGMLEIWPSASSGYINRINPSTSKWGRVQFSSTDNVGLNLKCVTDTNIAINVSGCYLTNS